MRTLKQLYQLLLHNYDNSKLLGICRKISDLYWQGLITEEEDKLLKLDFSKRKPNIFNKFWWDSEYNQLSSFGDFWWYPENHNKRKEFLQHIINLL